MAEELLRRLTLIEKRVQVLELAVGLPRVVPIFRCWECNGEFPDLSLGLLELCPGCQTRSLTLDRRELWPAAA